MENSAGCFQQHSVAARPRRTARAPAGVLTTLAAALVLLAALALAAPLPSAAGAPAAASQPGGAADAGQAAPAPAAVAGANGSLRREKPQQVADAARRILPETQAEALIREALLDGYDALSFPWKQHGAANVSMNIVFNKVLNVDLYAGEMVVAVWFRLRWNDPRLMWDANATGVPYIYVENPEPDQVEIWTPDVTLWNAANDIGATLGLKRPQVSANGDVYWTRNGVIQVSCNFRGLEAYPFGPMSCWLEMGSWVLDRTHMDLWPYGDGASLGGSITGAGNARHVEYLAVSVKVERNVYGNCSFPPCTDEWPTLIYKLTIVRASVLYTFKILLPQIVLTMVAFSTFWLSPECGERLGLAITVPLAVAVYDLLVFNSLPTSNKISFVSAMGLLAFLFSIAVLVVNAIVIQLWFYREPRYMQRLSTIANTMLSFKEQSVWVDLLKVLQELKQELARRQHEALQEEEARTKSAHRLARRQKSFARLASVSKTASRVLGGDLASPRGATAAAAAAAVVSAPMPEPAAAAGSDRGASAHVGSPFAREQAQRSPEPAAASSSAEGTPPHVKISFGGPGGAACPAQPGAGGAAGLRQRRSSAKGGIKMERMESLQRLRLEEVLASHGPDSVQDALERILEDDDPQLERVKSKVAKAVSVFGGTAAVAARLHRLLCTRGDKDCGGGDDCPTAGGGGAQHTASLAEFGRRAGDAYALKWQMLSAAIDHTCRWVFVLAYVAAVLATALTLTDGRGKRDL